MERLQLKIGEPETIALKYRTGKTCQPFPGQASNVMFTLVNGKTMFVPISVSERIHAAEIQPGEEFTILKKTAHSYELKKKPADAASTAPAAIAPKSNTTTAPKPASNGSHDNPPAPAQTAATPAQLPPSTRTQKLMACFVMAIDAISAAQDYCRGKQLGVTFTSEDVRAVAISCWIQCEKEGYR